MTIHTKPDRAEFGHGEAERFVAGLVARQPKAHSLHQALYTSDAAFAVDIERIFARYWILAGHQSQAPNHGDYFLHEMAGESIIIIRGQDRQLRAFANVCRHRGSHICKEKAGHAKVLVCPYHAWAYNLDGSLRSARYMPADFDKSSHGLRPVHLAVIEGLVFISIAEKPLALDVARKVIADACGPYGWGSAKVAHRETYAVDANWKLAVENYLECYHCAPAHPEYSKLHALEKPLFEIEELNRAMEARTCALGVTVGGGDHRVGSKSGEQSILSFRYALHEGVESGAEDGKLLAPPMGAFTASDGGVTTSHFAPSSFFIAYADHGVIYRFIPQTATTSTMELIWLVRGDAREGVDYDVEKLTWLWRVTTEADKRITEDNQKGVNSRFYAPGPYSPFEANAIRWIEWYLGEVA